MSSLLERRTITMPRSTVDAITARVGPREFSSYVADAAEERLRLDAIRATLADMESKHGPVDADALEQVLAAFQP